MVNTALLMDVIKRKNETVSTVAEKIGLDASTLYRKIAGNGEKITLQQADAMKRVLAIDKETAERIFFSEQLA